MVETKPDGGGKSAACSAIAGIVLATGLARMEVPAWVWIATAGAFGLVALVFDIVPTRRTRWQLIAGIATLYAVVTASYLISSWSCA